MTHRKSFEIVLGKKGRKKLLLCKWSSPDIRDSEEHMPQDAHDSSAVLEGQTEERKQRGRNRRADSWKWKLDTPGASETCREGDRGDRGGQIYGGAEREE